MAVEAFVLPSPRETLAGCMWLPRQLAKARAFRAGTLPADYSRWLGHALATDGQFLSFFGLTVEQVLEASTLPPEQAAAWFLGQPGVTEARIADWNDLAPNLGKPGQPMHEAFQVAIARIYSHVDRAYTGSVFEVIEADER